jgi:4-oxalocrotonate tautomerase
MTHIAMQEALDSKVVEWMEKVGDEQYQAWSKAKQRKHASHAQLWEALRERTMPHVIVKLWPGKSEQQTIRLAEAIVTDVMHVLHYGAESVSVAIEEVEPQDWTEKVYKPNILNNVEKLYKKPGYTMWTRHSFMT